MNLEYKYKYNLYLLSERYTNVGFSKKCNAMLLSNGIPLNAKTKRGPQDFHSRELPPRYDRKSLIKLLNFHVFFSYNIM